MMGRHRALLWFGLTLALGPAVTAAESASHKLTEFVFNEGGHPLQGAVPASASSRITLDAIGQGVAAGGTSTSASFKLGSGFVSPYPPPGEVTGLRFTTKIDLAWNAESSIGKYNLYRELTGTLPGGFGVCESPGVILSETTTDTDVPSAATAYFYLVTADNLLDEEGTKGFRSNGTERGNPAPCP